MTHIHNSINSIYRSKYGSESDSIYKQQFMIITISLIRLVVDQMRYNLESANYL